MVLKFFAGTKFRENGHLSQKLISAKFNTFTVYIIFSRHLEKQDKTETERQFPVSDLPPFLNNGVTLAILIRSGKVSDCNEILNIWC